MQIFRLYAKITNPFKRLTGAFMIILMSGIGTFGSAQRMVYTKVEKPILGWSSWSFLRREPSAAKMEAEALALHGSGLQELGYKYVNLDDFWYEGKENMGPAVDKYGRWVTDNSRFPAKGKINGIKVVADYIHSLGLKFGIYLTPGISKQAVEKNTQIKGTRYTADQIAEPSIEENNYNFHGMVRINFSKPGAQEFINSWADMFADWGVDFIKLDGMTNNNVPDIIAWARAIQQCGRPMVLDITQGDFTTAIGLTLAKYASQWEFAPDIECYTCDDKTGTSYPLTSWENVKKRFDYVAEWQPYGGIGGFNDYDAVEIGNGDNNGLTPEERKTQLSLWALGSSPIILGVDLTHLDKSDMKYLKNTSVLAVDQDGIPAKRFVDSGNCQVFAKIESNGDAIVGLFNTSDSKPKEVSIQTSTVGLPENKSGYSLFNLWTGETKKIQGYISAAVPPHGVVLYRVKGLPSQTD